MNELMVELEKKVYVENDRRKGFQWVFDRTILIDDFGNVREVN